MEVSGRALGEIGRCLGHAIVLSGLNTEGPCNQLPLLLQEGLGAGHHHARLVGQAVPIAEVELNGQWQRAVLGVSCVSPSAEYAHRQLERVVEWIESRRPDVELFDYRIEML